MFAQVVQIATATILVHFDSVLWSVERSIKRQKQIFWCVAMTTAYLVSVLALVKVLLVAIFIVLIVLTIIVFVLFIRFVLSLLNQRVKLID